MLRTSPLSARAPSWPAKLDRADRLQNEINPPSEGRAVQREARAAEQLVAVRETQSHAEAVIGRHSTADVRPPDRRTLRPKACGEGAVAGPRFGAAAAAESPQEIERERPAHVAVDLTPGDLAVEARRPRSVDAGLDLIDHVDGGRLAEARQERLGKRVMVRDDACGRRVRDPASRSVRERDRERFGALLMRVSYTLTSTSRAVWPSRHVTRPGQIVAARYGCSVARRLVGRHKLRRRFAEGDPADDLGVGADQC